ncbi:MAG: lipopolysaccharide heptosyltransferase II [Thermodesulfovibrionia bacterium]
MKQNRGKTIERILIRGVNWIGDSVLTLPAIRAIRKGFPDAHISILVKPWVSDIFKGNPHIDEIILYNISKLKLIKGLRRRQFDMAILLQNAFDAGLIAWLSGIPERIGYRTDLRGPLLTKAIPVDSSILKRHQVYYYLNLINSIGIETDDHQPYIHLMDDEREWARRLLNNSFNIEDGFPLLLTPPLIGLNPGATYGSSKRWLTERFAELIRRIVDELNGRVIIFGSPSEVRLVDEIIRELDTDNPLPITHYTSRILNMAGRTTLRELIALISECDVFITNDSGPMHIASALSVPTVAIFGSTNPSTTSPFGEGNRVVYKGLPCSPCLKRECPEGHLRCMKDITVHDVFSALKEVIPVNNAIFLDRDGTLIEDKNYLNSFDGLIIIDGVKKELARLRSNGFSLIGITNQSGIARGIVDERFVIESNEYLKNELGIDDFYYCPHHPKEDCECRKPRPMLLLKARLRHRIRMRSSYMIGDKESDMELAKGVGIKGILISHNPVSETKASFVAKDMGEAVGWILRDRLKVDG